MIGTATAEAVSASWVNIAQRRLSTVRGPVIRDLDWPVAIDAP